MKIVDQFSATQSELRFKESIKISINIPILHFSDLILHFKAFYEKSRPLKVGVEICIHFNAESFLLERANFKMWPRLNMAGDSLRKSLRIP